MQGRRECPFGFKKVAVFSILRGVDKLFSLYARGDLLVVHGFTVRCHRGSPPELDMNVRGHL